MKEEILDKHIKPFFDKKFANSTYIKNRKLTADIWEGFIENDGGEIFLGKPYYGTAHEKIGHWFAWGDYFSDAMIIFGIDWIELWEALRRYVNKEFGLQIEKIT
jgi:hypothetical protein